MSVSTRARPSRHGLSDRGPFSVSGAQTTVAERRERARVHLDRPVQAERQARQGRRPLRERVDNEYVERIKAQSKRLKAAIVAIKALQSELSQLKIQLATKESVIDAQKRENVALRNLRRSSKPFAIKEAAVMKAPDTPATSSRLRSNQREAEAYKPDIYGDYNAQQSDADAATLVAQDLPAHPAQEPSRHGQRKADREDGGRGQTDSKSRHVESLPNQMCCRCYLL